MRQDGRRRTPTDTMSRALRCGTHRLDVVTRDGLAEHSDSIDTILHEMNRKVKPFL